MVNLGNRIVNCWLLPAGDGYLLIDTGYENSFRPFLRKLKQQHISPKQIRYILLTHAHDDHAGFLNPLLRITDAKVILHPRAAAGLQRGQNSFAGGCAGKTAYLFCCLLSLLGKGAHRFPPIAQEYLHRLIPVGSKEFEALHFPFEIIAAPGHSADHIMLRAGSRLFCGDAAMNGFPSIRHTIIWIEDLHQYRRTWKRILRMHVQTIYPAHGRPFPAEALRGCLAHLDRLRLYPLRPPKHSEKSGK